MNNHGREKFVTIDDFEKKYGVKFTKNHTGKMSGFASLSTSPLCNTFCQGRCKCSGSICAKCYSLTMQKQYSNLSKMLKKNYEVLTTQIIPVEEMPLLNYLAFRFESFGDIQNENQIINYFNLCYRNPRVQFTIWSKNLHIFRKVFDNGYIKPSNLIIIASSPFINDVVDISKWEFVDKVFTVYEKDYAEKNGIVINCGSKSCLACSSSCYMKNSVKYVNELLK